MKGNERETRNELLYEIKYKSQVDNVLWQFNIFLSCYAADDFSYRLVNVPPNSVTGLRYNVAK